MSWLKNNVTYDPCSAILGELTDRTLHPIKLNILYSSIEREQVSLRVLSVNFSIWAWCGKGVVAVPCSEHHSTMNLLALNFSKFLLLLVFCLTETMIHFYSIL